MDMGDVLNKARNKDTLVVTRRLISPDSSHPSESVAHGKGGSSIGEYWRIGWSRRRAGPYSTCTLVIGSDGVSE